MSHAQRRFRWIDWLAGLCALAGGGALWLAYAGQTVPAAEVPLPGLWQGEPLPPLQAEATTLGRKPLEFWVLDTGGSGGGFGKGDVRNALHDVAFRSADRGWACGYGGVFRTEDGGVSWSRVMPAGGWYHVALTGASDVWLLEGTHPGGPGKVWLRHSSDDGKSWEEVAPGTFLHYWDMSFHDTGCWILGGGWGSWFSGDGRRWTRESFGDGRFHAYAMARPGDYQGGAETLYVVGTLRQGAGLDGSAAIMKSVDGGKNWKRLEAFPQVGSGFRHSIYFFDSAHGWVGGERGQVWRTSDGGGSWTACPLPSGRSVQALWFDGNNEGYAAVANNQLSALQEAVYATTDGGAHWQMLLNGAKNVERFFSLGPHRLWAVGNVPGYVPNDLVLIRKRSEGD